MSIQTGQYFLRALCQQKSNFTDDLNQKDPKHPQKSRFQNIVPEQIRSEKTKEALKPVNLPPSVAIESRILHIIYNDCDKLNQIIEQQSTIGIYGCTSKSFISDDILSHAHYIGKSEETKGIAEYSALNYSHILFLKKYENKQCSIIYNCKQIFYIKLNSQQQIQQFVENWENQIWSNRGSFLLGHIHKFTITISRTPGCYWVTVNKPIYDICSCYNWRIVGKNIKLEKDLQVIAYYLRFFYVEQMILLILKFRCLDVTFTSSRRGISKTEQEQRIRRIKQVGCYKSKGQKGVKMSYCVGLKKKASQCLKIRVDDDMNEIQEQIELIEQLRLA